MPLRRDKKPKPLGICTVCRDCADEHIRMYGTGLAGSLRCGACTGWGWLLPDVR